MRHPITVRLDPEVVQKARKKADRDNRTLTNYIETLMRKDLAMKDEPFTIEVVAPPNIREYEPIREDDESDEEFEAHKKLIESILDAGGY